MGVVGGIQGRMCKGLMIGLGAGGGGGGVMKLGCGQGVSIYSRAKVAGITSLVLRSLMPYP